MMFTSAELETWRRVDSARRKLQASLSSCCTQLSSSHVETRLDAAERLRMLLKGLKDDEVKLLRMMQAEERHEDSILTTIMSRLKSLGPGTSSNEHRELILMLDIVEGLCLISPESKEHHARGDGLNLILKHIDHADASVEIAALEAVEAFIAACPANMRRFEEKGCLDKICTKLAAKKSPESVLLKCIEVLYIYLSDESTCVAYCKNTGPLPISSMELKEDRIARLLGGPFLSKMKTTFAAIKRGPSPPTTSPPSILARSDSTSSRIEDKDLPEQPPHVSIVDQSQSSSNRYQYQQYYNSSSKFHEKNLPPIPHDNFLPSSDKPSIGSLPVDATSQETYWHHEQSYQNSYWDYSGYIPGSSIQDPYTSYHAAPAEGNHQQYYFPSPVSAKVHTEDAGHNRRVAVVGAGGRAPRSAPSSAKK